MRERRYAAAEEEYRLHLRLKGYTEETARTYPAAMRPFWDWAAAHAIDPTGATRQQVKRYIGEQLEAVAPSTVRNRLFALRDWFEMLSDNERDEAEDEGDEPPPRRMNPTAGISVKRPATEPLPAVSLSDQQRLVFRASSERDQAMWLILVETGMRIGELTKMQVEDIHWSEGTVLVHGKGEKARAAWLGPETLGLLRGIVGDRTRGAVWLTSEGRPMRRDGARKNFYRLALRSNVSAHPHQLRATFANNWLREGGDAGALQVAMGHSQLAMTMHYAGASEKERARQTARRLGLASRVLGTNVVDFDAAKAAS